MSDLLPLFPLPTVVLFPNVFLPLHIFEPGWQANYEGRPPVYPIGCSGVITHHEKLPDGRYNIILRGVERFRILEENHARSYRIGIVDRIEDQALAHADRVLVSRHRAKLESLLARAADRSSDPRAAAMTDEDLINALAQYLDFEPLEKQALLEKDGLLSRAAGLVELLEMKVLTARMRGGSNVAH
jgi:Lon protease-like protein